MSSRGSVVVKTEENALLIEDGIYQLSLINSAVSILEEYNSHLREKLFTLRYISASEAVNQIIDNAQKYLGLALENSRKIASLESGSHSRW